MFGFFKKKEKAKVSGGPRGEAGEPVISALLLEGQEFPTDAFVKQLTRIKLDGATPTKVQRGESGVIMFEVGDEVFGLIVMPAPYPAADLEGPIATSWMWPEEPPIESVKKHQSHLLITMTGGETDPVRRRLTLTAITALAAKQPGVMAVYWPEATMVHYPPVFVEMAENIDSPEAPPLYLWVDQRIFRNDDGTIGLFTTGMKPLGHMEMEIPQIDMEPGELREWLINIMYYVLENGPVWRDHRHDGGPENPHPP